MTLRNRIVNTAHGTNFARDHTLTDRHIYYHAERAKGGVGMSITETTGVYPSYDIGVMGTIWSFDERNIPWFRKLSQAVHQHGAKIRILPGAPASRLRFGAGGLLLLERLPQLDEHRGRVLDVDDGDRRLTFPHLG